MIRHPHIFVGGSTDPFISKEYYLAAKKIGQEIASKKHTLVFDGCQGLPGVVAAQLLNKERYSESILICTQPPYKGAFDWNKKLFAVINTYQNQSEVTEGLVKLADYLLFMKGNIGTITELFYAIDTKKNMEHNKPIIILNINHQWDSCIDLLKTLSVEEFYNIVETPEEAIRYINEDLDKQGYKQGESFFRKNYIGLEYTQRVSRYTNMLEKNNRKSVSEYVDMLENNNEYEI